ncbi:MAG TPA: hypothetical protein ENO22_07735 [candidate division Zixibacteria bacterium]|nr:hypothetical protein [candidate division Zixibacteria bacterium]HEQ99214.1 hypothetical protein [candidate division Zixibacteria bacterium]
MSRYQPPGRLSKVSGQDFMIQIQTEFAWHPNARITTSVVLDGVIIHKIQKEWNGPLETDDEQELIRKYINRQHDEVEKIIRTNQEFILNYSKTQGKDNDFENIIGIEGVASAFLLSSDGLMTPFREEEIDVRMVQLFERLFELVEFLDHMTRWGSMHEAYLVLKEDRIMIFRYRESFLIVVLEKDASPGETAKRVMTFLKAA